LTEPVSAGVAAGDVAFSNGVGGLNYDTNFYWNMANHRLGLGTTNPGFLLDVANRMRVRQGSSSSAGIWFYQKAPAADRAFIGMSDDHTVGLWGNTGAGWALRMDTVTGHVGINFLPMPGSVFFVFSTGSTLAASFWGSAVVTENLTVDGTTTTTNIDVYVSGVGTRRVKVGEPNSGGTGRRMLYVDNS
jgi:hypothetical protein